MGDAVIRRPQKRLAPHLRVVEVDFLKPATQNDNAREADAHETLQRAASANAGATLIGARNVADDWE